MNVKVKWNKITVSHFKSCNKDKDDDSYDNSN